MRQSYTLIETTDNCKSPESTASSPRRQP